MMAPQVKALAANPNDLSLTPKTHRVGENRYPGTHKLPFDCHTLTIAHLHPHRAYKIHTKQVIFLKLFVLFFRQDAVLTVLKPCRTG